MDQGYRGDTGGELELDVAMIVGCSMYKCDEADRSMIDTPDITDEST